MTKEEAQQFVRKAISHAMARDGSSGGVIRMVVIDKSGVSTVISLQSAGRGESLTYGRVYDELSSSELVGCSF